MTEDRTKLHPRFWTPCSECGCPSLKPKWQRSEWATQDISSDDEKAAIWAFVDEMRAEGAAAERERLATAADGLGRVWDEFADEFARWIRAGGPSSP